MGADNRKTSHEEAVSDSFERKVLIVIAITTVTVLAILLFIFAFRVLLLIMAGILFAVFFRGIAELITKYTHLKAPWSLVVSFFGIIAIAVVAGFLVAPKINEQVDRLSEELPKAIRHTREQLNKSKVGRAITSQIPKNPQKFLKSKDGWFQKTFGIVSSTFGIIADTYIIIFIGIFMMVKPQPYVNGIVLLVPLDKREKARDILKNLGTTLKRWIAGKVFAMFIVFVLTAIGLAVLGVPLTLVLALFAGLTNFIPNFGPLIGGIPALLIGFMQGGDTALYIVLLYTGIQFVESNLITPLVQRKMVYLPPAMIITAQVLLGVLVGGLGLLLATPIVATAMVLVKTLYVRDVLGDKSVGGLKDNH